MTHLVGQLEVSEDAVGVPGADTLEVGGNRKALFAHIRADDLGRYRPLSGARTLPTGWRVRLGPELSAEDAVETVYPLALIHQRQLAERALRVVGLDEVLLRQSGRYESSSALSPQGREQAVATICGECVRRPVWDWAPCGDGDIPCPEPCSVLVAFCREAALWEADPPSRSPVSTAIAWAAFEEPGNELRERYLQEMANKR
ncbi:MAG: DR2241 family protein [Dehalococcoidia bacterium]